jgi:site-specific DNA-methyltransferase (adenine-specific)
MKYPDDVINKVGCGDCLDVMKKFPDKSVDWIITDPPYEEKIGKQGFTNSKTPMDHGGLAKRTLYRTHDLSWDNFTPTKEYFDEMIRISKNQIIFGGNFFTQFLPPSRCWIVWDKKVLEKYSNDYADCELVWTSLNKPIRIVRFIWHGMIQQDMKHKEKRLHPTQKPVGMLVELITKMKITNQLIFDPFIGVGSVALASIKTGNRFIGIDISEDYCNIARQRILGLENLNDKDNR